MVDSFLQDLTHEKRYSPHTVLTYKNDLAQLGIFLSDQYELQESGKATYAMLRHWVGSLSESGLAPNSINRKIIAVRSYFRFLQKRRSVSENPARRLRTLKTGKPLPQFIEETEMARLIDHRDWDEGFEGLRDLTILELLYGTGMRLSELTRLKVNDVDLYGGTVKVLGKRNKERVIPVTRSLEMLLRKYLDALRKRFACNDNSFLIVTDKGEGCYPMFVNRTVKRYIGTASVDRKSPHVLRHTYATHLLDHGADLNAVKDLLGHQSLAATQIYTHTTPGKLKKIFDQAHPKA